MPRAAARYSFNVDDFNRFYSTCFANYKGEPIIIKQAIVSEQPQHLTVDIIRTTGDERLEKTNTQIRGELTFPPFKVGLKEDPKTRELYSVIDNIIPDAYYCRGFSIKRLKVADLSSTLPHKTLTFTNVPEKTPERIRFMKLEAPNRGLREAVSLLYSSSGERICIGLSSLYCLARVNRGLLVYRKSIMVGEADSDRIYLDPKYPFLAEEILDLGIDLYLGGKTAYESTNL